MSKEKNQPILKLNSSLLAAFLWVNTIALMWLLLLRVVPSDGLSASILVFFIITTLLVSDFAAGKKKKDADDPIVEATKS